MRGWEAFADRVRDGARGPRRRYRLGQVISLVSPGSRHLSLRTGPLPLRIVIVVTLEMYFGLVTVIVSLVPARNSRSNCWMWKSDVACATSRSGHALPSHVSVMRTPRGARTVSSATFAPLLVSVPLMRTIG